MSSMYCDMASSLWSSTSTTHHARGFRQRSLSAGLGRDGPLDVEAREELLEPVRNPPVAVAEELHDGRDEHHPHERGVQEDRRREADAEQLQEDVRRREEREEDDHH